MNSLLGDETLFIDWPGGKKFAFTIFDDTDFATIDNVSTVYAQLRDLGFLTTKSVWPLQGDCTSKDVGSSCEDPDYLDWLLSIRRDGFEIGYHMAKHNTSSREITARALDRFRYLFGSRPITMANHSRCAENMYWGPSRLAGINKHLYNWITLGRYKNKFRGHLQSDPLFWGDLCQQHISYCRNFIFPGINTLAACPQMPYHDPYRPWVNNWFASSEGPEISSFLKLLHEENQDRLEEEGGACIVYTHLACGFSENGKLNKRFQALMARLAKKNGWFVPVSTLLNYLLVKRGKHILTSGERNRLERKWLWHKLRKGSS